MPDRVEALEQAEIVEEGEGRRMHRVAAEVAEEVGVLLEHRHRDARPGEEEAEHQPRGAAADDRARRAPAG
jgi:hypothetical protein